MDINISKKPYKSVLAKSHFNLLVLQFLPNNNISTDKEFSNRFLLKEQATETTIRSAKRNTRWYCRATRSFFTKNLQYDYLKKLVCQSILYSCTDSHKIPSKQSIFTAGQILMSGSMKQRVRVKSIHCYRTLPMRLIKWDVNNLKTSYWSTTLITHTAHELEGIA